MVATTRAGITTEFSSLAYYSMLNLSSNALFWTIRNERVQSAAAGFQKQTDACGTRMKGYLLALGYLA